MRRLFARLRIAWRALRFGVAREDATAGAILTLLHGPAYDAAQWAVRKIEAQRRLKASTHALQRSEAQQWAMTYAREAHGIALTPWEAGFLVELAVGLQDGRLPEP